VRGSLCCWLLLIGVVKLTALFSPLLAERVFTANKRRYGRLLLPVVRRSDTEVAFPQFASYVLLQTISTGCLTPCMYWGNSRRITGDWNGGLNSSSVCKSLSCICVFSGRDPFVGQITRPEVYYWLWVCLSVIMWLQYWEASGPLGTVAIRRNVEYFSLFDRTFREFAH